MGDVLNTQVNPLAHPESGRTDGTSAGLRAVDCVLLVVTAQCNLRCSYCYQNSKKPLKMQWDTLQTGVGLALSGTTPLTHLMFSGGEPLLEFEHIRKAVEYAEAFRPPEKRVRYWLGTNGMLLFSDVADFLQEHDFTLQLSFDGIAPAQAYRGAHTFDILDRLLDSLRTGHPQLFQHRLQIAMTVIPNTVRHMASSVDYLIRKGARDIRIAPGIAHNPGWTIKDLEELDLQIARISDISRHHLEQTGEVPARIFRKAHEKTHWGKHMPRRCNGLNGRAVVVDVDGRLYGCPLFAESGQDFSASSFMVKLQSLRMGDIREPGLTERRAAVLQAAQRLVPLDWKRHLFSSYGECGECQYFAGCSVCPVSIWNKPDDRDPFRVPDFICAFNRAVLKYRERFPYTPGLFDNLQPGPNDSDPIDPLEAYLRAKREREV
jgi:sulfatase maturation enzyme AslB (radical SAM superfamily)